MENTLKKNTVMLRVTPEVRQMIKTLAGPNDTADDVLRRQLGMPEAVDTLGLVKSLGEWPFKSLELNQDVTIPWPIDATTRLTDEKKAERIRRAVYRHQRATGNLYHMNGTPMGLRIQRIK